MPPQRARYCGVKPNGPATRRSPANGPGRVDDVTSEYFHARFLDTETGSPAGRIAAPMVGRVAEGRAIRARWKKNMGGDL